jgi:hypothetical protein
VVICSYNDHVRLLSPSPLVGFSTTKVYSGIGADIVMESISLKSPQGRQMSVMGMLRKPPDCMFTLASLTIEPIQ